MSSPENSPPAVPDDPAPAHPRSAWRDFWQLDLPAVIVIIGCAIATIVEFSRAGEGVWRAWVYTFEWPLIGLFAVWIWYRYRIRRGVRRPRKARNSSKTTDAEVADPALSRWQEYQQRLKDNTTPRE